MTRRAWLATAAAVLLVTAALGGLLAYRDAPTRVTAQFDETVALYRGDQVRVLGVPVGRIDSITPGPTGVEVVLEFDSSVPVPADARAVIISPSLVSTRYVQLVPAYRGGPRLADGAVIPAAHTATPVEFDELKTRLARLITDLGPTGANHTGALGRALDTVTNNLAGQGTDLHTTLERLSKAANTLAGGDADLFATVRNLNGFVTALDQNDRQVRAFITQLAAFSGTLEQDSHELRHALSNLDTALGNVERFVRDNRTGLVDNVTALRRLTGSLATQRQTVADLLQIAPGALSGLYNIYDPLVGGLKGSPADPQLQSPAQFLCASLFELGAGPEQCAAVIAPLADLARSDHLPGSLGAAVFQRNGGHPEPVAPSLPLGPGGR